ncbi:PRTRC system protein E [Pedobacter alluvionis]|uniref:PRTRC genetic system protein E n=1 Tax=Pedobacter alluvionis TaxID=475253 RepID=A0A497Y0I7_9SPHI|nr:PRTRC system protein E [Pedobacter alluvionis]RLJ75166.1 PRTRC genetic system protein E [Pedobacter alluvionis]TFB30266.1 PRTRC system protein E [Pedobacter alluvionis]
METTNFFNQIARMQVTGTLQIAIKQGVENNWIVSVLLQNESCGDNAKNLIVPCTLKGTAEELDADFFATITSPLEMASGLMVNMEAFMKQLEESKKQSAMEKEKTDREKKEKEAKAKKYTDALQKAEELEKEGKFREAWTAMPKVAEYPEHAEEIRKRQSVYERHFAPSLFNE